jgi:hypothetical protein
MAVLLDQPHAGVEQQLERRRAHAARRRLRRFGDAQSAAGHAGNSGVVGSCQVLPRVEIGSYDAPIQI